MSVRVYQIALHAAPERPLPREITALGGISYERLLVAPGELPSFGLSFEEALERFSQLPLASVEPDGAVFCRSSPGSRIDWQLEGVFYDRAGSLLYATFTGNAAWEELLPVFAALRTPPSGLLFQLLQQGIFLDAGEFRRWLTAAAAPFPA